MEQISRRQRLDLNTPAELAIYTAMLQVEHLEADERLTKAIDKLSEAKELVADFVDEVRYNNNIRRIEYLQKKFGEQDGLPDTEIIEMKELAAIIEEYEEIHFSLPPPTAEDIKQFNEEQGIKDKPDYHIIYNVIQTHVIRQEN